MNSTTIVETNYGLVQGVITISLLNNVFHSYLGIPYAKPPIGDLRFKVGSLKNKSSCSYDTNFCEGSSVAGTMARDTECD